MKENTLFYALGGGLGHLTRILALLNETMELPRSARVLASSNLVSLVKPLQPCPVDVVPPEVMSSRKQYYDFLKNYLFEFQFKSIVLDTFPWGIVGEWSAMAPTIPRILLARYLNWQVYIRKFPCPGKTVPHHVLTLETLDRDYLSFLRARAEVTALEQPIILNYTEIQTDLPEQALKDNWLVVHSGPDHEQQTLIALAKENMRKNGHNPKLLNTVFPHQELFPVQKLICSVKHVVSGTGYNLVALASQAPPRRNHYFYPFPRLFDDQALRLQRFKTGLWQQKKGSGNGRAAQWLLDTLADLSPA
ncbi:hypothetical protein ACFL27_07490 [candidate division CSSED10-310 bacterium]|uniref:Glycosyl transferase family 28 C-terminal domain-containing protein n=1 Tax=candidate division CSSED10-310 bacterium TaxID=2855610 RepID=A0ABV6YUY1_UNCC1